MIVGAPAPAYEIATYASGTVRVGPASGPQPLTLLNIWATWCIPCRKEFPTLEGLHQRHAAAGLRVVGISVDQGGADEKVQQSAAALGGTFPIARDADGRVQDAFRSIGVPETFLIGADGTLLWRHAGDVTPRVQDLEEVIRRHLAGAAP